MCMYEHVFALVLCLHGGVLSRLSDAAEHGSAMAKRGASRLCEPPGGTRIRSRGGGSLVSGRLRAIAHPFAVAAPSGMSVPTRLRVSHLDEEVLIAIGSHLGSLAGGDLALRCSEGRLDTRGKAASRRVRKQALTAKSSSRWAGAI